MGTMSANEPPRQIRVGDIELCCERDLWLSRMTIRIVSAADCVPPSEETSPGDGDMERDPDVTDSTILGDARKMDIFWVSIASTFSASNQIHLDRHLRPHVQYVVLGC